MLGTQAYDVRANVNATLFEHAGMICIVASNGWCTFAAIGLSADDALRLRGRDIMTPEQWSEHMCAGYAGGQRFRAKKWIAVPCDHDALVAESSARQAVRQIHAVKIEAEKLRAQIEDSPDRTRRIHAGD